MSRTVCGTCWCPYDEFTGECACPLPGVRYDTALLRQALEALEHHVEQTRPIHRTSETITALRERLEETK